MFMNCDVSIEFVRFSKLGRTNKNKIVTDKPDKVGKNPRGRYPLHFHKCENYDAKEIVTVQGSVVDDSPGWGFVNHSSNVSFLDNIAYNFNGAGFVTESGEELGEMDGNLSVGGKGLGGDKLSKKRYLYRRIYFSKGDRILNRLKAGDLGFDGEGFWIQAPLVSFTHNIAAGNHGAGILFYGLGLSHLPEQEGLASLTDSLLKEHGMRLDGKVIKRHWAGFGGKHIIGDVPIYKMENNESYANYMGLKVRYMQHPDVTAFENNHTNYIKHMNNPITDDNKEVEKPKYKEAYLEQEIVGMELSHNYIGAHFTYNTNLKLKGFTVIGEPKKSDVGLEIWHQSISNMKTEDIYISGYDTGLLTKDGIEENKMEYGNNKNNRKVLDPKKNKNFRR